MTSKLKDKADDPEVAGKQEICAPDLRTVERDLHSRYYVTVFQHIQGPGNVFTLWTNLYTGDELLTVSQAPRNYGGVQTRPTEIFRLSAVTMSYLRGVL